MIPTVQFDPATLAIWTTTGTLLEPQAQVAETAMRLAVEGDDPTEVVNTVSGGDSWRTHLIWLVSSVWHEKRHYFDTCLTNYGARRFRNLFNLASNVAPLLVEARARHEPVWFPVEVYGDRTLRRVLGISDPAPNILQIARHARLMKSFTSQLDATLTGGGLKIHLGGEAQLEGLAQVSQVHSIEACFGMDDMVAVTADHVHSLPREGPYRTIETIAGMLGCVKEFDNHLVINTNLAAALFVTALCGRYFGAGPQPSAELVAPWERLERMIEELGPTPGHFDMTGEEAFELVDQAALRLWGRTAFDEIAADIDAMESKVNLAIAPWLGEAGLYDVYTDFIRLRRQILAAAQAKGPASLLPYNFPLFWRDILQPWHVFATPAGNHQGDTDAPIVFGQELNLPSELKSIFPSVVVWGRLYAVSPDEAERRFAPRDRAAWLQMLERHGPLAQLMLNGRQHRRMVPPELDRPIYEIEKLGIGVRFHPRFEWPDQRDEKTRTAEAIALANFTGRKSFVCDITGDEIEPTAAAVLTPLEFRRSALLPGFRNGDIVREILLHTDWSDWVVRRDLLN
jgi:hypothetical protein